MDRGLIIVKVEFVVFSVVPINLKVRIMMLHNLEFRDKGVDYDYDTTIMIM